MFISPAYYSSVEIQFEIMYVLARKCQTTAVLLFLPSCIHFATHEETVILEENVM